MTMKFALILQAIGAVFFINGLFAENLPATVFGALVFVVVTILKTLIRISDKGAKNDHKIY